MKTDTECRFCNIEKKDLSRILVVRTHTLVIFSNPRLMPGHLLVIPRRHAISLSVLPTEERKELFDTAIEFQDKIIASVSDGCDIRQHNRQFLPESNLKVNHVHIHLQPRTFEDGLHLKSQQYERELFKPLTQEEIDTYRRLLSN